MVKTGGSGARKQMMQHQAVASLAQAAPVQNTWYTVLDTTKNVRLVWCALVVATTNETLQMKITIDGETYTAEVAATAGTYYNAWWGSDAVVYLASDDPQKTRAFFLEGRSVKVEVRKTTAAGAGTITSNVLYAKIP